MNKIKYFVSLDENGIVENLSTVNYSHSIMECSVEDKSITNNYPEIGSKYDAKLNAFILPKPDETYILNKETYEWEPDPTLEYSLDSVKVKWNPETKTWFNIPE